MKNILRTIVSLTATLALAVSLQLSAFGPMVQAVYTTPVNLGRAANFAVLAQAGITNTGATTITGDVGTFATTTETGFETVTITGTNHAGDSVTQGAQTDLLTAYNEIAGRTPSTVATELGGTTRNAGVYNSAAGTFGITGTLTLDAQNDPNAVFIFQMASTLTTITGSVVTLINGAQASNVYWQVGSSATLGANSTFRGTILANTTITVNSGATVNGRLLAGAVTASGAVTLATNTAGVTFIESYSDSSFVTVSNSFGATGAAVYTSGMGYTPSGNYRIAYYDASAAGGGQRLKTSDTAADSTGRITDSSLFPNGYPSAIAGTWKAVVSTTGYSPPASYSDYSSVERIAEDTFTVSASAIPEVPGAITGMAAIGMCFVAYYFIRKKPVMAVVLKSDRYVYRI